MVNRATSEDAPISYAQERYTFLPGYPPDVTGRICMSYRIEGPLDVEALVQALGELVDRHQALRIAWEISESGAIRQLDTGRELDEETLVLQEVEHADADGFDTHVTDWLHAEFTTPWRCTTDPVFRVGLFRSHEDLHALVLVFACSVIDGRSVHRIDAELWPRYDAIVRGDGEATLPEAPGFLASVARQWPTHHAAADTNAKFWRSSLSADADWAPFAALQAKATADQTAEHTLTTFDGETSRRILKAASGHRATPFQWLLTAFLNSVREATDVPALPLIVATDFREPRDAEVAGMFVANVPVVLDLRQPLDPASVRISLIRAVTHGMVPGRVAIDCQKEFERRAGASLNGAATCSFVAHRANYEASLSDTGIQVRRDAYRPFSHIQAPLVDMVTHTDPSKVRVRLAINKSAFDEPARKAIRGGIQEAIAALP